ncbi:hypothetical protein GCM10019016_023830 [Streptomyces prasinosporus]|uniref:GPP34 family phosphoprotein n=2 Tax=Streptomyces TaxID=1883 RepID=A0ABP6TL89_9ACTN
MPNGPLSLPARLCLLAWDLDPTRAAPVVRAGALADLARRGLLVDDDGIATPRDLDSRTGDPALDGLLELVSESFPHGWRTWVTLHARHTLDAVREHLVAEGVLRAEKHRVLGVFSRPWTTSSLNTPARTPCGGALRPLSSRRPSPAAVSDIDRDGPRPRRGGRPPAHYASGTPRPCRGPRLRRDPPRNWRRPCATRPPRRRPAERAAENRQTADTPRHPGVGRPAASPCASLRLPQSVSAMAWSEVEVEVLEAGGDELARPLPEGGSVPRRRTWITAVPSARGTPSPCGFVAVRAHYRTSAVPSGASMLRASRSRLTSSTNVDDPSSVAGAGKVLRTAERVVAVRSAACGMSAIRGRRRPGGPLRNCVVTVTTPCSLVRLGWLSGRFCLSATGETLNRPSPCA